MFNHWSLCRVNGNWLELIAKLYNSIGATNFSNLPSYLSFLPKLTYKKELVQQIAPK